MPTTVVADEYRSAVEAGATPGRRASLCLPCWPPMLARRLLGAVTDKKERCGPPFYLDVLNLFMIRNHLRLLGRARWQSTKAAAIVERLPVIVPDCEPWEQEFEDMQHELNVKYTKPLPKFLEDRLNERMSQPDMMKIKERFTPAPRITEDDVNDVRTSTNRKLDRSLILIVKLKDGSWGLPEATWTQDPESIRQTAERAVKESVGESLEVSFTGQAPIAHLESDIDKVFFLRCFYTGGYVHDQDYLWVTKEELKDYVKPDVSQVVNKLVVM